MYRRAIFTLLFSKLPSIRWYGVKNVIKMSKARIISVVVSQAKSAFEVGVVWNENLKGVPKAL